MILCIQNLFGTGSILISDEEENVIGKYFWNTRAERPNILGKIAELLPECDLRPGQITDIVAVEGPGPFTAVRTLAVILRIWKSQFPQINLYAIPSGEFLRKKFPEAESLFLAAGKTAFFHFDPTLPKEFHKYPNARFSEFLGICGGFLDLELFSPARERDEVETFQKILAQKTNFLTTEFIPVYGAEANITPQKKE